MKTYKHITDKKDSYRNDHGAYFEKITTSMESYQHFCDGRQRKYMPPVTVHDIHGYLFMGGEVLEVNYCPLCGKRLV